MFHVHQEMFKVVRILETDFSGRACVITPMLTSERSVPEDRIYREELERFIDQFFFENTAELLFRSAETCRGILLMA